MAEGIAEKEMNTPINKYIQYKQEANNQKEGDKE